MVGDVENMETTKQRIDNETLEWNHTKSFNE
jgi:hypothetical protein